MVWVGVGGWVWVWVASGPQLLEMWRAKQSPPSRIGPGMWHSAPLASVQVEAAKKKRPVETQLGTSADIFAVAGEGDGHVPRNLRLCLQVRASAHEHCFCGGLAPQLTPPPPSPSTPTRVPASVSIHPCL